MSTYRKADPDVLDRLRDLVEADFPELAEAGVRLSALFALAARDREGQPKGPALKIRGYPCLALVRVISVKDRVSGMADAQILLSEDEWPDHSPRRQESILFHELAHLLVVRDKDGTVKLDDANRPKLKIRPHDLELGVFKSTIEKYGGDSVDAQACEQAGKLWKQLMLSFAEAV